MLWIFFFLAGVVSAAEDDAVSMTVLGVAGVLVFLGASLAFATGIGGGGIYIPILILLCGLSPKAAIPVSKAIIFGGSVTSLLFNCGQTVDSSQQPVIDYHVAAILQPCILLGTFMGVMLNRMMPEPIILALLCVLLTVVATKSGQKSLALFRKESGIPYQAAPVESDCLEDGDHLTPGEIEIAEGKGDITELPVVEQPKSRGPAILLSLCNFAVLVFSSLAKGTDHYTSIIGVEPCTLNYFLIFGGYILFSVVSCGLALKACHPGWSPAQTMKYCCTAWLGGLGAGVLGIGGGLIVSPMLLTLGYHPQVAAATSSYMIVFTSAATTFQFALLGMLDYSLSCSMGVASLLGAVMGLSAVSKLVAKYKRPSLIGFALTGLIVLALITLPIFEFQKMKHASFAFESICPSSK